MNNQIVEEVIEWNSRPFSGGYAGLRELGEKDFTGAVTNGTAWLFLLNGRVVAAVDGAMDAFENADGTAYAAPHPSVPLLFAMQERGGEAEAKYYTEETPLSDVDGTLSSGTFTGYVELSENVLSGDYYVVYHGGQSLACAFIGNSRRLLTGDEALERADDEVGIYQVYDVDIDVIQIPEGNAETGSATALDSEQEQSPESDNGVPEAENSVTGTDNTVDSGETTPSDSNGERSSGLEGHVSDELDDVGIAGASADTGDGRPETDLEAVGDALEDGPSADDPAVDASVGPDDEGTDTAEEAPEEPVQDDAGSGTASPETQPENAADEQPPADVDSSAAAADSVATTTTTGAQEDDAEQAEPETDEQAGPEGSEQAEPETDEQVESQGGDPKRNTDDSAVDSETEDPFSEEAQWRETQSIPSLDPSNSETEAANEEPEQEAQSTAERETASAPSQPNRSKAAVEQTTGAESAAPETATDEREIAKLRERLRELEIAKEEAEATRERLAAERQKVETERDEYRQRARQLESRVEDLQAEVDRLESALEDADGAGDTTATRTMPAGEALSGTNLFMRYESKGGATLEKSHAGEVEREAVVENLRLEHHTSFETDGLRIAEEPFETFLRETVEYRFVRWVVENLLYEIRNTGHEAELQKLFDSIPDIDRAELDGTVSIEFEENGETHREQEQFDLVLRDRMGNPLIVANLNAARDPASGEMMTNLIETARRVKDSSDTLASAFLVTTSYFQPDALETADNATGGGLLSREKRKSFIKLSRKRGFHLCLVETRDGNFHVNVPEL